MKKTILSRSMLLSGGVAAIIILTLVGGPIASAAVTLDPVTTGMLVNVVSATGNLVTTVQAKINAHAFTPSQSVALSATLGAISGILVNISAMIGGITLPNTGEAPAGMAN